MEVHDKKATICGEAVAPGRASERCNQTWRAVYVMWMTEFRATGRSRATFALFVAWDGTDGTGTARIGYIYNEITKDEA